MFIGNDQYMPGIIGPPMRTDKCHHSFIPIHNIRLFRIHRFILFPPNHLTKRTYISLRRVIIHKIIFLCIYNFYFTTHHPSCKTVNPKTQNIANPETQNIASLRTNPNLPRRDAIFCVSSGLINPNLKSEIRMKSKIRLNPNPKTQNIASLREPKCEQKNLTDNVLYFNL